MSAGSATATTQWEDGKRYGRRAADGTPLCDVCGARMRPMTGEDAVRMWPDMEVGGGPMPGVWICPNDFAAQTEGKEGELIFSHEFEQEATGFEPFRLCARGRAVYEKHIRAVFWEDIREKSRAVRQRVSREVERQAEAGPVRRLMLETDETA